MNRFLLLAVFIACAGLRLAVALPVDLTPQLRVEHMVEGGDCQKVYFKHGDKLMVVCPPPGWKVFGQPDRAQFVAGGASSAQVTMRHQEQENTPAPTWDEDCMKALRAEAATLLPAEPKPVLLEEVHNPFVIANHDTMAYTFSGVWQFRKCKFLVFLLFLEKERFSFVLYADEHEFDAVNDAFRPTLFRMYWVNGAK